MSDERNKVSDYASHDVDQTKQSFKDKWESSSHFQIGGLDAFDSDTLSWIHTRNGFSSVTDFIKHVSQYQNILDAGCGNGRVLALLDDLLKDEHTLIGVDFSSAEVARKNLRERDITIFEADLTVAASLEDIPRPDFIYCQEVLHHTSNPGRSFKNLIDLLMPGGEIAIYVYKIKAPVREFTDDYVRNRISNLPHEEAMDLTKDFAEFGKALSDLNALVDIPELRLLGIKAGTYPVQRLFYNFFVKCYWNEELSMEDNNMINYDWYHPSLCSRHTVEEVHSWFFSNDIQIIHSREDDYGITVRGKKS